MGFSEFLIGMKTKVAALWVAVGGKPVTGAFSTNKLEKLGFVCPKMTYSLRCPAEITNEAQRVSQDGAKNKLENILQNNVSSPPDINIVKGLFVQTSNTHSTLKEVLQEAFKKIPSNEFAFIVIDDTQLKSECIENLEEYFSISERPIPEIFAKPKELSSWSNFKINTLKFVLSKQNSSSKLVHKLKEWLCEPKKRKSDVCMIGTNHRCNGMQTKIVIHIIPEDCPDCGDSSKDPVISSRATAMFILSKYKRLSCPNCEETLRSFDSFDIKPKGNPPKAQRSWNIYLPLENKKVTDES